MRRKKSYGFEYEIIGGPKLILETLRGSLPSMNRVPPMKLLSALLRSVMILNIGLNYKSRLRRRLGLQLDQGSLEEMLLPNLSYMEIFYGTDCAQRLVEHSLQSDQSRASASVASSGSIFDGPLMSPPSLTPLMMVARLLDP